MVWNHGTQKCAIVDRRLRADQRVRAREDNDGAEDPGRVRVLDGNMRRMPRIMNTTIGATIIMVM